MRYKFNLILPLILTFLLFVSCREEGVRPPVPALNTEETSASMMHIINPDSEMRGVWIASVYNIDYPSAAGLGADALKSEIDAILDKCGENMLNTVFFQVRPACDALYKSEIFPVSAYLSSDGDLTLDVLDYLLDEAHHRNIRVYAWVNPLRVAFTDDVSSLDEKSPARLHPEWTVAYEGRLYLNAGLPEVINLVSDGVGEIVAGYDVDGVVFDDYFYPGQEFDDADEYKKYGSGFDNIGDWRRDNVNRLIAQCCETVHSIDSECEFGVSPSGVWRNNDGRNGGSDTQGYEAYTYSYCDATAWIDAGTIDFISPQIYWSFSETYSEYDTVLRWWNMRLDKSKVKLYVSHAAYKYDEWDSPAGQMSEQITYARAEKSYYGSLFYGFDEIKRDAAGINGELRKAYEYEVFYTDIISNGLPVTVTSPADGSEMSDSKTYIIGSSDPYYPLTMNGERIGRTKSGYFSVMVTLEAGENIFLFEQNGKTYEYKLRFGKSALELEEEARIAKEAEEAAALAAENETGEEETTEPEEEPYTLDTLRIEGMYPTSDVITADDGLWVSCVAPYGAVITAELGGITTELGAITEPAKTESENGYVAATYGKTIPLPEADAGMIIDCGKLKFTAEVSDGTAVNEAADVRRLGEGAYVAVCAREDSTPMKISTDSSVYDDYIAQSAGMTAHAVSLKKGWYTLDNGAVISADTVFETERKAFSSPGINSAVIADMNDEIQIRFIADENFPYDITYASGVVKLTFFGAKSAASPLLTGNSLVTDCVFSITDAGAVYSISIEANLYRGFDLRYEDSCIVFALRKAKKADFSSETPLEGITVLLDAGHGGWDSGAAGAVPDMNEEDLNLAIVLETEKRLSGLGAEVVLTREGDALIELNSRVTMLDSVKPDAAVSVHQNSMGYASDVTRIRGTLALYTRDAGGMLADCVGRHVASSLDRNYRGAQYQALAVCRNPKFPSCLVETGFMTSVEEYELSSSEDGISKTAEGIVAGLLEYFS